MTALLDEPRIAYATRKVRRFRDDFEAWKAEFAPRAELGVWEDVIHDGNLVAKKLLALDDEALQLATRPGEHGKLGTDHLPTIAAGLAEWVATGEQILEAVTRTGEHAGEVAGINELRKYIEEANRIVAVAPIERVFRELV